MNKFHLAEEYFSSVPDNTPIVPTHDVHHPETGELVMQENVAYPTIGYKDHPEFTKLRYRLHQKGFIEIQELWSNGDSVIREFTLNDVPFEVGEQFCCAAAIGNQFKYRRKRGD